MASTRLSIGPAFYWTPKYIALTAWYDASDTSTIIESGGAVSQWNDISGNGLSIAQGTGSKQPTTGSHTLNGKNVVYFDSDFSQIMTGNLASSIIDDVAIFSVQTILGFGSGLGRDGLYALDGTSKYLSLESGNSNRFDGYLRTDSGVPNIDMTPPTTPYTDVITNVVFDSSSSIRAYMNGVERGSAVYSGGGLNASRLELGSDRFNIYYMSCDTAELIITTDHSTETRLRMEGYLAHKWGLTANLPSGHPYETSAP